MNKQCEIVVILPTVSVDAWLDTAVASILSEDQVSLRLLVVHDGVEPDMGRPWMSDDRVSVLHFEDRKGLVNGLSAAIAMTDEPYVGRLDADDICLPGRFQKQLRYMTENEDVVVVASDARVIGPSGEISGVYGKASGPDVRADLLKRNVVVHSSVLLRRDAYLKAGGFDTRLPQMEDYDLWLRMGMFGRIAILDEPLVSYRVHPDQVSHGSKPYGIHIDTVRRSRRALARRLGANRCRATFDSAVWRLAQYSRYYLRRRPVHDH